MPLFSWHLLLDQWVHMAETGQDQCLKSSSQNAFSMSGPEMCNGQAPQPVLFVNLAPSDLAPFAVGKASHIQHSVP